MGILNKVKRSGQVAASKRVERDPEPSSVGLTPIMPVHQESALPDESNSTPKSMLNPGIHLVDIDRIIVSDRVRTAFGDVQNLADDIQAHGLINPVTVTSDLKLLAGERRLRAMKSLDFKQVEVRVINVVDEQHALEIEISENIFRKDFSKIERIDCAKRLERIESVKAKERQGTRTDIMQNFAQCKEGTTRDLVAKKIGIGSGETYRKEKFIVENADPELLAKWDIGEISTNKAYLQLTKKLEEKAVIEVESQVKSKVEVIREQLIEEVKEEFIVELSKKEEELLIKNKEIEDLKKTPQVGLVAITQNPEFVRVVKENESLRENNADLSDRVSTQNTNLEYMAMTNTLLEFNNKLAKTANELNKKDLKKWVDFIDRAEDIAIELQGMLKVLPKDFEFMDVHRKRLIGIADNLKPIFKFALSANNSENN